MINAALATAPFTAAEVFATVLILLIAAFVAIVVAAQINATAAKRRAKGCKGGRCGGEGLRVFDEAYGLKYARFWCADHDVWSIEL